MKDVLTYIALAAVGIGFGAALSDVVQLVWLVMVRRMLRRPHSGRELYPYQQRWIAELNERMAKLWPVRVWVRLRGVNHG